MKKIKIVFEGRNLLVLGEEKYAEPEVGIMSDYFEIYEIKENDINIDDEIEFDEEAELSDLCLKQVREDNQSDWESANA